MNIRKHWKKFVLSCAALFWASCGDDASTKPIQTAIDPDNTEASNSSASSAIALYGVPMYNVSSSDVTGSCTSDSISYADAHNELLTERIDLEKDSIIKAEGSIDRYMECKKYHLNRYFYGSAYINIPKFQKCPDGTISEHEQYIQFKENFESTFNSYRCNPYKLASDTTILCDKREHIASIAGCNDKYPPSDYKEQLYNDTEENLKKRLANNTKLDSSTLRKIEQSLGKIKYTRGKYTNPFEDATPLYGVSSNICGGLKAGSFSEYQCTNGKIYAGNQLRNDLVYSAEEMLEFYLDSLPTPSPLCQKTDFIDSTDFENIKDSIKTDQINKAIAQTNSEEKINCLNKIKDNDINLELIGTTARTQICDGDTTINEKFKNEQNEVIQYLNSRIIDCDTIPDTPQSETPEEPDSTVTE